MNWYNIIHCNICKKINIPRDDICKNICGKIYGRFHCFDCCNSLNKPFRRVDKSLDESSDENFDWQDCQDFVKFHDLHGFHDQCVGVDTSGNRTNYEQEKKLAPDWSLRPKARPPELEE